MGDALMYALVQNDTIVQAGSLPRTWFDGTRWWDFRTGTPDPSTGWLEVVEVARPADTATHTHDRTIGLVAGTPTVVWTQRPFTADELAAIDAAANDTTIRDRALQALTANATFLARPSPTNAQVVAQVQLLTRECTGLIRLALGELDSTDGT